MPRIRITTNMRRVLAGLTRSLAEAALSPNTRAETYARIMSDGVQSHFDRLGRGGSDSSALGAPVVWSPERHPKTLQRRGGQGFPLLDMGKGFLRSGYRYPEASARPIGVPRQGAPASALRFGPTNANKRRLGEVHQGGLRPLGAGNRGFGSGFRVPKRPFAYWDKAMNKGVEREVRFALERALRKNMPRGGARA